MYSLRDKGASYCGSSRSALQPKKRSELVAIIANQTTLRIIRREFTWKTPD
jgi:hypothetical protein